MHVNHALSKLFLIMLSSISFVRLASAGDLQFNTELLDVADRENIELGLFSKPGYIMPGSYLFKVNVNNQYTTDKKVTFTQSADNEKTTTPCLSRDLVEKIGFTKETQKKLEWSDDGECLIISSVNGMTVKGDLPTAILNINIPQAYLEYRSENWLPASLWDHGINGAFLDYSISTSSTFNHDGTSSDSSYIGANGVVGLNLGAWRARADWQSNYQHYSTGQQEDQTNFDWSRFYVYRAIPELKSTLTLGENYLSSDLFDSFRFTGATLASDLGMLPPALRGYAPQVTGVAQSNARVVISQQGRVLYQTQVPAGPFKIQDLNDSVSGVLNVRIEEEDGSVREFDVNTASIPFLTRPGTVRYKAAVGKPSTYDHKLLDNVFGAVEFSWGVSNGWSLFGGTLNSDDYNAFSLGVGRDLLALGAISFDVTQSFANIKDEERLEGRSYRINYAKRFEELNSQIQFAGYRFSERDFLTMSEFLDLNGEIPTRHGRSKEMYNISLSQNLPDYRMSFNLNLNHQTYWNAKSRDYYNLSLNKIFDIGSFKNANLSLSGYQNKSDTNDRGAYLTLNLPLNSGARVGYSSSLNNNDVRNQVSYFDRLNNKTNYQLNASYSDNQNASAGAFIAHRGDRAEGSISINHTQDKYTNLNSSIQGGMTFTGKGFDAHRINGMGGTRVLLDTEKFSNIPVNAGGLSTASNYFGKAILTDINDYIPNRVQVDVNNLPNNVEVENTVFQKSFTRGAIGYHSFGIVSGEKKMLTLILEDGSPLAFGTSIYNSKNRNVGMVDDNGRAYLSGINLNEKMTAKLGSGKNCVITFTENSVLDNDTLICKFDMD